MGIPDEPFWAPPDVVEAYREHAAARGAAAHAGMGSDAHRRRRSTTAEWQAAWNATGMPGWDRRPADRSSRARRSPPARRSRRRSTPRCRSCPASSPAPPTSPATPARSSTGQSDRRPSTPGGRQIHFGVREHAMGATMVGMARARRRPAGRRHVLRVPRLHAPAGAPRRRCRRPKVVLRLHPRLGRRRRGRPDPPADRAAGHAAGDPRAAGDPAGRRQRDRRRRGAPPSSTTARRRSCSAARTSRSCTDGSAVDRGRRRRA